VRSAREKASYEKRGEKLIAIDEKWKHKMVANRGLERGREVSGRIAGI
jgi:hypothetical protein